MLGCLSIPFIYPFYSALCLDESAELLLISANTVIFNGDTSIWSYERKKEQEKEYMGLKGLCCPVKCKHCCLFLCLLWRPAMKLGSSIDQNLQKQTVCHKNRSETQTKQMCSGEWYVLWNNKGKSREAVKVCNCAYFINLIPSHLYVPAKWEVFQLNRSQWTLHS